MKTSILAVIITSVLTTSAALASPDFSTGNNKAIAADETAKVPVQQLIRMRDQTQHLAYDAASAGNSNTASQLQEAAVRIQAQIDQVKVQGDGVGKLSLKVKSSTPL